MSIESFRKSSQTLKQQIREKDEKTPIRDYIVEFFILNRPPGRWHPDRLNCNEDSAQPITFHNFKALSDILVFFHIRKVEIVWRHHGVFISKAKIRNSQTQQILATIDSWLKLDLLPPFQTPN